MCAVQFLRSLQPKCWSGKTDRSWEPSRILAEPAFRQLLVEHGYTESPSPSGSDLDARFWKQDQRVEIMRGHHQLDGVGDHFA